METGKIEYPIANTEELHELILSVLHELLDDYNKKNSKIYHANKSKKEEAERLRVALMGMAEGMESGGEGNIPNWFKEKAEKDPEFKGMFKYWAVMEKIIEDETKGAEAGKY